MQTVGPYALHHNTLEKTIYTWENEKLAAWKSPKPYKMMAGKKVCGIFEDFHIDVSSADQNMSREHINRENESRLAVLNIQQKFSVNRDGL